MNIFLESANLDEIRSATSAGLADGVAFSYVAFSADAPEATEKEWLEEISREFALPVCVPVGAVASDDIYAEARELAKVSDPIVVICATFVFNGAQAVIASKCGASMVRVTLAELESYGQSGAQTLAEIKNVLESGGAECDVMAASPTTAQQFAQCATAGADIVSLSPETLRRLVVHPFSDRGVDRFLNDLAKRPKSKPSS
jgi:transaldolase